MKLHYTILWILLIIPVQSHAQDKPLNVVASYSILADVVQQVVGDHAQVTTTIPVGADPHSFKASPGDLTTIANADVVFVNGGFFEEGLLELITNASEDVPIVEVSSCINIITFSEDDHMEEDHNSDHLHIEEHVHSTLLDFDSLCSQHDEEFLVDHEPQNTLESPGKLYTVDCTEITCDPHVWMNPDNVMYWTMLIRDTLIELDPTNAEVYRANASEYLAELDTLMSDLMQLVDTLPQEKRVLITSHDSLGYLARTFDFKIIGTIIPSGTTVAEPSVQDIATLIDLIRAKDVSAIFAETTVNTNIAQTISSETGAELIMLYSGSLGDDSQPAATYLDYMRYNFTAIVEALSQ